MANLNPAAATRQAPRARQRASDTPDPSFATTLARGLELLDAFRAGDTWLSNAELAQHTGLARPTVSRLTGTLARLGYLKRNEAGRFKLGIRVLGIAYPLLAGFRVRQVARPLMREFAEQAGGAVSIGMAEGANLVYLETTRSNQNFPHIPEIGFSCPLVSSGIGRAAMSLMSAAEEAATFALIAREQPALHEAMHERALAGIADCRSRGWCAALGDWRPEIFAVAAPLLRTADGECLSINCGIPSYRVSPEEVREFGPKLASLASAIRGLADNAEPWR